MKYNTHSPPVIFGNVSSTQVQYINSSAVRIVNTVTRSLFSFQENNSDFLFLRRFLFYSCNCQQLRCTTPSYSGVGNLQVGTSYTVNVELIYEGAFYTVNSLAWSYFGKWEEPKFPITMHPRMYKILLFSFLLSQR